MNSVFKARTDSAAFRLRWRGYDRAQVDQFLEQTAADRQRLQEDLAQLEALMARAKAEDEAARRRELDRLTTLRREVASCLETSIGALRTATGLLSMKGEATAEALQPAPNVAMAATAGRAFRLLRRVWMSPRPVIVLLSVASVCGAILTALQHQSRAREMAVGPIAAVSHYVAGSSMTSRVPAPAEPRSAPNDASRTPSERTPSAALPVPVDGLVLTLTARRSCWIGTSIDGSPRLERLLQPNETIMLRARNEVVLRVGDAAALSVLINNQLTKPLGAPGQVVTRRITRTNFLSFLV